jgi:hypothetical protein
MVLKGACSALIGAVLLMWSGASIADEYRPGEFFSLDPSRALLSPKPLGPPAEFERVPVEAKADRVEPKPVPTIAIHKTVHKARVVQSRTEKPLRSEKPRAAARTRLAAPTGSRARTGLVARTEPPARTRVAARTGLARRHGNPLDAQAFDTRIQVWPCNSGGICNWKQ